MRGGLYARHQGRYFPTIDVSRCKHQLKINILTFVSLFQSEKRLFDYEPLRILFAIAHSFLNGYMTGGV